MSRTEAAGFGHSCGVLESAGESLRFMGVAAERDRRSALVAPPTGDFRAEWHSGVDFQYPTAVRKHAQGMTELILERSGIEGPGGRWPVPEWVIDVSEHGERIGAFDEAGYLGEVIPDNL